MVILDFRLSFDLQVVPTSSYQVSSQLVVWVKEMNFEIDCQDGSRGVYLRFSIRMILSTFSYRSHPDTSNQVTCQLVLRFRRKSSKQICNMAAVVTILVFRSERF